MSSMSHGLRLVSPEPRIPAVAGSRGKRGVKRLNPGESAGTGVNSAPVVVGYGKLPSMKQLGQSAAPAGVGDRLALLLSGDEREKAWLYDRFSERLYRRLRGRYGGGRFGLDPEELLHDSFVSFFQNDAKVLANFLERVPPAERTKTRLEAYLWGLACGIASNRRRSLRRRPEQGMEDPDRSASEDSNPEIRSVVQDSLERMVGCLKTAGSRIYLYYKLRFVDGFSPAEISEATGWSMKATYKLKLALNDAAVRCGDRLNLR